MACIQPSSGPHALIPVRSGSTAFGETIGCCTMPGRQIENGYCFLPTEVLSPRILDQPNCVSHGRCEPTINQKPFARLVAQCGRAPRFDRTQFGILPLLTG